MILKWLHSFRLAHLLIRCKVVDDGVPFLRQHALRAAHSLQTHTQAQPPHTVTTAGKQHRDAAHAQMMIQLRSDAELRSCDTWAAAACWPALQVPSNNPLLLPEPTPRMDPVACCAVLCCADAVCAVSSTLATGPSDLLPGMRSASAISSRSRCTQMAVAGRTNATECQYQQLDPPSHWVRPFPGAHICV